MNISAEYAKKMVDCHEAFIEIGPHDLHVSFPKDTDLNSRFRAFCHDELDTILISGWLIEDIEYVHPTTKKEAQVLFREHIKELKKQNFNRTNKQDQDNESKNNSRDS